MSNNIHNTNVDKVNEQVELLINELSLSTNLEESYLQDKYSYLYSTSKTLFNFIVKQVTKPDFNKEIFDKNLKQMLSHILKIQKNEISQNSASEIIGKLLAKQFIPQYK